MLQWIWVKNTVLFISVEFWRFPLRCISKLLERILFSFKGEIFSLSAYLWTHGSVSECYSEDGAETGTTEVPILSHYVLDERRKYLPTLHEMPFSTHASMQCIFCLRLLYHSAEYLGSQDNTSVIRSKKSTKWRWR